MLGYHHETTTRLATAVGSTWNRYAPDSHTRSQPKITRSARQQAT